MQRGWAEEVGAGEESEDPAEMASRGSRVRLSLFTWERLAAVVAALVLGTAFLGDESDPVADDPLALAGHRGLVESTRFSPDGKALLSLGWDRTVRIWDVADGPVEGAGRELARLLVGAEAYAADFSPDGATVAIAGIDGLTLWDWRAASAEPRSLPGFGPSRSLAFAPDGRTLALGGFDRAIRLVDVQTGEATATLNGHVDVVRKLAFTPDARSLISLSFDGSLKTWGVPEGRETSRFRLLEDATRPILTFALAPAGDVLAITRFHSPSHRIEIWDVAGGVLDRCCGVGDAPAHTVEFSRNGSVLASSGSDFRVRFWNAKTGKGVGAFDENLGWVRTLDFSADGRWMALSSNPDQVLLKPLVTPNLASHPIAETAQVSRVPGEA